MKDYKAIWNNLSTSFADASFYVCCIGNEDEIRQNGALTAEFLRSVLKIEPTDKVLEIGCGVARIGRELAASCAEWHGCDISGNMIAYAKDRTADIRNIFLHELPDNSLRIFPDATFDCVYSSIVFMHLDKLDMFTYMCEAYRVLKPGGRVYFDTYNVLAPQAWQEFLKVLQSFPPGQRPGHVSQFSTPQEFHKFMDEAGYESVHVDDQNPQLVVALGIKPMSAASGARVTIPAAPPTAPMHVQPAPEPAGQNAPSQAAAEAPPPPAPAPAAPGPGLAEVQAQLATSQRVIALLTEINQKNTYVHQIESELTRKNAAIADLERRLRRREAELISARRPRLAWLRRKPRG